MRAFRLDIDPRASARRDRERHVLFASAAVSDRARVLAAVPCVDGDDDRPIVNARERP